MMDNSRDSSRVADDRTCSLLSLRAQAGKPLRVVILEIYDHHSTENSKSNEFLENLKCFLPSETSDRRHASNHGRQARPLTLIPHSQAKGYVAISYPWNESYGEATELADTKYRANPSRCAILFLLGRSVSFGISNATT
ncbi:hypothetical protein K491DRAFT_331906 [Lophiostoma macrostomum CBS 122681]|uniref:Uncharacterized protein n=1 Tax=Lophiostoma macrostomum CBS 122681 TaxID=1314788 RepID=A0A6A6SJI7_9PLEO|nr:hypothetical protein K491DRAFT_331906 [Lophiostoma macrostomum CBS 122681]